MGMKSQQDNVEEWDRRAERSGLHAVFTTRWSQEECDRVDAEQQRAILEMAPDLFGKAVLDLGCGIGRLTRTLATTAARVVGVDVSHGMISRARQEVQHPRVEFIETSADAIPLPDASFDGVIASYVFQHILDDQLFRASAAEVRRLVRRGGFLMTVDGTGASTHQPANSRVTVVRGWQDYAAVIGQHFAFVQRRSLLCVEDDYTVALWRTKDGSTGEV